MVRVPVPRLGGSFGPGAGGTRRIHGPFPTLLGAARCPSGPSPLSPFGTLRGEGPEGQRGARRARGARVSRGLGRGGPWGVGVRRWAARVRWVGRVLRSVPRGLNPFGAGAQSTPPATASNPRFWQGPRGLGRPGPHGGRPWHPRGPKSLTGPRSGLRSPRLPPRWVRLRPWTPEDGGGWVTPQEALGGPKGRRAPETSPTRGRLTEAARYTAWATHTGPWDLAPEARRPGQWIPQRALTQGPWGPWPWSASATAPWGDLTPMERAMGAVRSQAPHAVHARRRVARGAWILARGSLAGLYGPPRARGVPRAVGIPVHPAPASARASRGQGIALGRREALAPLRDPHAPHALRGAKRPRASKGGRGRAMRPHGARSRTA